jgi:photosynthesis system II assembly factor YCF48-like protein/putative zinc finger protein
MPELSNLLRQRLAAGQTKGFLVHPDADTLTAYAEQSLSANERQNVVLHLAQCEECREVVALSQTVVPEMAVQTVVKPAPVSGWRRLLSPTFGLAAAVAAMALIAVMVMQLPQKTGQPAPATQQAKATSSGNQAADQITPAQPTAQADVRPSAAIPERSSRSAAAPRTETKERDLSRAWETPSIATVTALPSAPSAKLSANATAFTASVQKKDYLNTNFFDANSGENYANYTYDGQNSNDSAAAPQPQAGASSNTFAANNSFSVNGLAAKNSGITIFSDIPQNANSKSNLRILTPAPPSQPFGYKLRTMAEATVHALVHPARPSPAIRVGNLGNSTMGSSGMFASTLEKSQPAEVPATAEKAESGLARTDAFTPNALSARLRSESAPIIWKVAGGKLLKAAASSQWEDAYPSTNDSIEFSFVTARGNDVWAGGSHAALVHSRDAGTTWEMVHLGKAATGNIVAIIAGASTVLVKTSDNQTWSSSDGGNTWILRNE